MYPIAATRESPHRRRQEKASDGKIPVTIFVVVVVVVVAVFMAASLCQLVPSVQALSETQTTVGRKNKGPSSAVPNVFPASVRQALVEKSKAINSNIANVFDGSSSTATASLAYSYATRGWSNRAGTVLTPQLLAQDESTSTIYTADRPFLWNQIDVGCRCTVIELPSSSSSNQEEKPDLWVHSPVGLDGPLQKALEGLGNVKYVVSPNYEHVKFAPQWSTAFSGAEMWGCPGLAERMPTVDWKGEIPQHCRPPGYYGGGEAAKNQENDALLSLIPWDTNVLQPLHVDVEVNPFTGKPFFNEVVYFHHPSKTLITTDLYWNYPRDGVPNSQFGRNDAWELAPQVPAVPWGSRMWKFGMDQLFKPFYSGLMVTNKEEYKKMIRHIVNQWDPQCVIPAHGDILRGTELVRSVLKEHFGLDADEA
jgi:hypothetical protein